MCGHTVTCAKALDTITNRLAVCLTIFNTRRRDAQKGQEHFISNIKALIF